MWTQVWNYVYYTFVHPMLKWILRRVTGKCEVLRIGYGSEKGAPRTYQMGESGYLTQILPLQIKRATAQQNNLPYDYRTVKFETLRPVDLWENIFIL